jgi:SpoVK/Ycf46/Vps4 family AAA+-type ATPase
MIISTFFCSFDHDAHDKGTFTDVFAVIRPQLPTDFLEPTVGAFEDSILSLFSYIDFIIQRQKCVLLLDNIDHILGSEYADGNGSGSGNKSKIESGVKRRDHLSFRIKNTFLAIMDRMRGVEQNHPSSRMKGLLVICTSISHDNEIVDRFDKIFHLDVPNEIERQDLIETGLNLKQSMLEPNDRDPLAAIVTATI